MTGMEPADAQALASRLAAKNIDYQIRSGWKDGQRSSRQGGLQPPGSCQRRHAAQWTTGLRTLRQAELGADGIDEKVNYQRALEGELERTIQTLRDVESARVHLVMPTDSVFLDREREAKASVILRLRSRQLSEDNFEVSNDSVLHGTHSMDFAGCFAEHGLGLLSDGQHLIGIGVDCDNGRFC